MRTKKAIIGIFYNKGKIVYIYDKIPEKEKNEFYLKLAKLIINKE